MPDEVNIMMTEPPHVHITPEMAFALLLKSLDTPEASLRNCLACGFVSRSYRSDCPKCKQNRTFKEIKPKVRTDAARVQT